MFHLENKIITNKSSSTSDYGDEIIEGYIYDT